MLALLTELRDTAVSVATVLLYNAGKMKGRSGCTILEGAIEKFVNNPTNRHNSSALDGFCAGVLGWSICGFSALYGIDPRCALNAMRGRGAPALFRNLAETIATRGFRKPFSLNSPISVVWSLSKKCNLRCAHCYQDAERSSPQEMDVEEQLQVADELAESGVSLIVLSGGEPLLNRGIFALIRRFSERGMAIALDSNGTLIDTSMAGRLREAGINSVQISIDSISRARHDEFRGMSGAFERAREAVKKCSRAGIFTTVATTVTQRNSDEVEQLVDLARKWGARRISIFDLIPAGRGLGIVDEALCKRERISLMRFAAERSRHGDIEVVLELPQLTPYTFAEDDSGANTEEQETDAFSVEKFTVTSYFNMAGPGAVYRSVATYLGGCPAGRLYCNIQPNGDVTPCMFMPTYPVAGNLRANRFREIWDDAPAFRMLREREFLKGRCNGCVFRLLCGGCRAKAAAYFGDYLQEDPTCPLIESKLQ